MFVFPDSARLTAKWVNEGFIEAGRAERAFTTVPKERPARFVKLSRMGGVKMPNLVYDKAIIAVEAWAPSDKEAGEICQWVRARIEDLSFRKVDGFQCALVDELAGPQAFPDRDSHVPRYLYTVQVPFRGKAP